MILLGKYTIHEDTKMKKIFPVGPETSESQRFNRGFSLVELIIVIAIMAILAAAIAPALIRYITKSRKASDLETASVLLSGCNNAYSEGYSFEGKVDNVQQDADQVDSSKIQSVSQDGEDAYNFEVIAYATGDQTFTSNFKPQSHFMDLFRKAIGKEVDGSSEFSSPKCTQVSGNVVPEGFLIGRKLDDDDHPERFEVWVCSGTVVSNKIHVYCNSSFYSTTCLQSNSSDPS